MRYFSLLFFIIIFFGFPSTVFAQKQVALTFDADLTPAMAKELKIQKVKTYFNQPVLDILLKEKIEATIFLTGLWTKQYPAVAKTIAANPQFEIGNHSYSHPAFQTPCFGLPQVDDSKKIFQISLAQDIIQKTTGVTPHLFRFPGGCHSPKDQDLVESQKLTVVGWNLASGDAYLKNPQSIVKNVLTQVVDKTIIVFHLNGGRHAPATAPALFKIISSLKTQGYSFVKVSKLL